MIRKLIVLIKAILTWIIYTVERAYLHERAVMTLKKQVLSTGPNHWVEYIVCHTPMNYREAFSVYNFYCIYAVSTHKTTKSFTNLVMDMAGRGFTAGDIKLCIYIAYREAKKGSVCCSNAQGGG